MSVYDLERRHETLRGAVVEAVRIDGGIVYLTLSNGVTVSLRARDTQWSVRESDRKQ